MITFNIPNLSCGHCVRAVTEAIQEIDPAAVVTVDIAAKTASVDSSADPATLRAKLDAEGYPAGIQ